MNKGRRLKFLFYLLNNIPIILQELSIYVRPGFTMIYHLQSIFHVQPDFTIIYHLPLICSLILQLFAIYHSFAA